MTAYNYSIATNFTSSGGRFDSASMDASVRGSSIVTALDYINRTDDTVTFEFKASISGADKTTLDGLVAAHTGTPSGRVAIPIEISRVSNYGDSRIIRRLGNLTAASVSEVLVFGRTYAEPASEAQRSIVSTNAQDFSGGTGAKKVRIYYLNSSYVLKTEDVTLNGLTAVNTVATDIRFVESIKVISGTFAAGAVTLMTLTGGNGTEIMGISSGTTETLAAHHYVPAGKQCNVVNWNLTVDDETKFKLISQDRVDGTNLVDRHSALVNLMGISVPPGLTFWDQDFLGITAPEKSYIRITCVPNQATSTVIRATLVLNETSL